jgi:NAD(P)-dependent dehydrogenase (short-subunit alcohol dehydrogenase family)
VAIVTGAASGIGRTTAELFAAEGACVMCADIQAEAVRETARLAGHGAIACTVDVSQAQDIERMVAETLAAYGKLDVLYANAGIAEATNAIDMTLEQWNRMISINLTSVWLSSKYALPHMIAGGGGSIINQSSTAGLIGIPDIPHYSAAKTGVVGLTRQIAAQYGPQNIRCNAICPSSIPTPLVAGVWKTRAQNSNDSSSFEAQQAVVAARHPLRRLGVPRSWGKSSKYLRTRQCSARKTEPCAP